MIVTNSDLILPIELVDQNGETVRVSELNYITIHIFTNNTCIDKSASVITTPDADFVYINAEDFEPLKSGVIGYTYKFKIRDNNFSDQYYDCGGTVITNYYYKDAAENGDFND